MNTRVSRTFFLMIGAAALLLSGCSHLHPKDGKSASASKDKTTLATAIATAAKDAGESGMTRESLMFQEKLYRDDPRDPENILNYARGLRRNGRIDDALLVVRTPAKGPRATEPLLTECAMVLIANGQYVEALEFAQKALEKDGKSPDAHHALALTLSGLGKDADAQLQFEKALELWPETRDKTPIINNLAMSLAAQGKISEARTVMSQATGEALRSPAYQNNRALLDSLKDRDIRAEKIDTGVKVQSTTEVTSMAPVVSETKKAPVKTRAKMQPIIE